LLAITPIASKAKEVNNNKTPNIISIIVADHTTSEI
jgi:hypothetical protein